MRIRRLPLSIWLSTLTSRAVIKLSLLELSTISIVTGRAFDGQWADSGSWNFFETGRYLTNDQDLTLLFNTRSKFSESNWVTSPARVKKTNSEVLQLANNFFYFCRVVICHQILREDRPDRGIENKVMSLRWHAHKSRSSSDRSEEVWTRIAWPKCPGVAMHCCFSGGYFCNDNGRWYCGSGLDRSSCMIGARRVSTEEGLH